MGPIFGTEPSFGPGNEFQVAISDRDSAGKLYVRTLESAVRLGKGFGPLQDFQPKLFGGHAGPKPAQQRFGDLFAQVPHNTVPWGHQQAKQVLESPEALLEKALLVRGVVEWFVDVLTLR